MRFAVTGSRLKKDALPQIFSAFRLLYTPQGQFRVYKDLLKRSSMSTDWRGMDLSPFYGWMCAPENTTAVISADKMLPKSGICHCLVYGCTSLVTINIDFRTGAFPYRKLSWEVFSGHAYVLFHHRGTVEGFERSPFDSKPTERLIHHFPIINFQAKNMKGKFLKKSYI